MSIVYELIELGEALAQTSDAEIEARLAPMSEQDQMSTSLMFSFAEEWKKYGRQTYDLQHSMAALLAATRSPELRSEYLPFPAFVIKVPSAFLPIGTAVDTHLFVANTGGTLLIGIEHNQEIAWSFTDGKLHEDAAGQVETTQEDQRRLLLAYRMVSNVVAFVTEHRECVERTTKPGAPRTVHNVRPPRDVVIDRAFRDRVSTLVRAGTQAEVRSALAHVVRGHWRNQACGPGLAERRLTWVRPHRRGDAAFGSVIARREHISARDES